MIIQYNKQYSFLGQPGKKYNSAHPAGYPLFTYIHVENVEDNSAFRPKFGFKKFVLTNSAFRFFGIRISAFNLHKIDRNCHLVNVKSICTITPRSSIVDEKIENSNAAQQVDFLKN